MWNNYNYDDLLKIPPIKKPCFLAGTLVSTENGLLPIEDIRTGQRVYARNMVTGRAELKTVTQTFTNHADMYIRIATARDVIAATGQHRFWLPQESRWCMANSLKTGMALLSQSGQQVGIQGLEIITGKADTYNLEVQDHHNYYVGGDEVLTHNQTGRPSGFASTEVIENVRFYRHFAEGNDLYIGQTVQGIGIRYEQHMKDYVNSGGTKKTWMAQEPDVGNIRINGSPPPYKMTRYEIAVVEMYEINKAGGRQGKDPGGKLFNKQRPLRETQFEAGHEWKWNV